MGNINGVVQEHKAECGWCQAKQNVNEIERYLNLKGIARTVIRCESCDMPLTVYVSTLGYIRIGKADMQRYAQSVRKGTTRLKPKTQIMVDGMIVNPQIERSKYMKRQAKRTKFSEMVLDHWIKTGNTDRMIGDAIGVSPSCVWTWRNGKSNPTFGDVPKICKYFNITPNQLFEW